jgi:hypothetical protein
MDIDELLDAIIASIFLIIVSLIGIYFPYIITRIFGTHNPYLILEVAGFITYSTSEPGKMGAAFLVTNDPSFFYEFRIIPPMEPPINNTIFNNTNNQNVGALAAALELVQSFFPLYDNKDFLISIGICYVYNLWDQLLDDVINSFMTEIGSYGLAKEGIVKAIVKTTAINAVSTYGLYTYQSALLQYEYGNHNILGDIFNALQSSVGPTLWSTLESSILQIGDIILDEVLPPPFDFVAGFAFNLAFTSAVTLIQYSQDTSNPYVRCYYNKFIQTSTNWLFISIPNGDYTVYQPYLTLSIYYNPNFTFYNECGDVYLCNQYEYIYNPKNITQDYIFKLELGNVDNNDNQIYPEFIILSKEGVGSGGPSLSVSIIPGKTS